MRTTSTVIGQQFAFAHGRAGVLQQSLLTQSDIDRLLGSHDRKEVEQVLTELKFTKLIDQSIREPDAILQACGEWVRTEIAKMTPESMRDVFGILWLDGDIALLGYLIKQQLGLTSDISQVPTPAFTFYDATELRALITDNVQGTLPTHLVSFVRELLKEGSTDPKVIDARVFAYCAEQKIRLAKKSGSKAILTFVRHSIDMHNIRTILRFTEEERADAQAHLAMGGTIAVKDLHGSTNHIASVVRNAEFFALSKAIEQHPEDTASHERLMSDVLANDVAVLWNVILSIEPVFAFAVTALAHIRLIRAVLLGKRNELSPQQIKSILPPFLSASHYAS